MRHRLCALSLLAAALVPAGCQSSPVAMSPSTGVVTIDDLTATAVVTRLDDGDQFQTAITIERLKPNGRREVIAAPKIITMAGQTGAISIDSEETGDALSVEVHIPPAEGSQHALISMIIEQEGKIIAAPRLLLRVPEAGS